MNFVAAPTQNRVAHAETSDVLINAVTYTFPSDRAAEAETLLRALRDRSREEPGCLAYDVGRSIDEPTVFVLSECWADQDALDSHYATPHFRRFGFEGIRKLAIARTAVLATPI